MVMSDSEVKANVLQAKDQKAQIKICAELNNTCEEEIRDILNALSDSEKYGTILRAKGIVAAQNGTWIHYDYVPEEIDVRTGAADYTGRICVIGSKLNEEELKKLFGI